MKKNCRNIRLFVKSRLTCEQEIVLDARQSHYLCNVMRCEKGMAVRLFNGCDGEFAAEIIEINKKQAILRPYEQLRKQEEENDVWLLFAPLKKDKTDMVIEKAVELGVSKIIPTITKFVNCEKIKNERFELQATEAAEQCQRLSVPEICEAKKLCDILDGWNNERVLFFMNEKRVGKEALSTFSKHKNKPAAILIGPEGGFAAEEIALLEKQSFVETLTLGPRILRAETAAICALTLWQASVGDWKK